MQNKKRTIPRKSIQNPKKKDTSSELCRTIYTATRLYFITKTTLHPLNLPKQHSISLLFQQNFFSKDLVEKNLSGRARVNNILNIHDVPNIWHIPLLLRNQNAHDSILQQLNLVRK
ncbi:CTP synthase (glutamine hydrolyzing) [Trifolium repens]|nr:CTP synthase (glutamine hydrolyzing) [Trifolium repens]